ncbi:Glycoside hydrolase family 31 protein [Rutstroemia sp. NJR-2017a BBW]|nr:Glycoside hydrolase family 31 protein [Rutstroemia sp. NJR-2017a BBW]
MSEHRSHFPVHPVADPKSIVGGSPSDKYRFTVLTPGLLRYEWAPDSVFEDRASVFALHRAQPVPSFRIITHPHVLELITSNFHLTYNLGEVFAPSSLSAGIKGTFADHSSMWRYGEASENLGGTARTLDDADGRIPLGTGVLSRRGFATVDDSGSMLFDEEGFVATRREGEGRVDGYLFAYGHDYQGAVQALYTLSGKQPLLPRWALGNWWSRYYPYSDAEYLALMDRFAEEKIPFSVAVLDMDWHLVDDPKVRASGKTGWTGYTWNKKLFPNPESFLAELHKRKLKVSLNDHPADGVQSYEELYPAMAAALDHPTQENDPIHFDITSRPFLNAFFDVLHRPLEKQGVDFWWVDWQQGSYSRIPGIDPLWVLNHFHFLDNALGNKRPLTFSRYAGPGSHRYPVGFSGDTIVTWDSLAFQPEFTATASNIGYGWWSHDIGGHLHGYKDDELGTRWVQLGCFSPVLRLHSSNSRWNNKEPWTYGREAEGVMGDFLRLRHRLLPYLYTMNARSAIDGVPLVRPMYWVWPEERAAYKVANQFVFGSELLVMPVVRKADAKLRLGKTRGWLPGGRAWVDVFTGARYRGGRELVVSRGLEGYPVFAGEGAIVPLDGEAEPGNGGEEEVRKVEVWVVVGMDGSFEMLEDDGMGSRVEDVQWVKTPIKYEQASGKVIIGPTTGLQDPEHKTRDWSIRFLGLHTPDLHATLQITPGDEPLNLNPEPVHNGTLLHLNAIPYSAQASISISIGNTNSAPVLTPTDPRKFIRPILADAQVEYKLKERIWGVVDADGEEGEGEEGEGEEGKKLRMVSGLLALRGVGGSGKEEENLRDAVMEYIFAG